MHHGHVSKRQAFGVVAAGAVSYTCLMFVWFSLPAYLTTIIDDVGLTGTEAGLLAGAVPLTYVPLSLLSGLVVDRLGPARSLAAGLGVFGVAQIARSAATGFPTLLAATVLLGVGATAITFGLPKLVSVLFPPGETGLPSAVYLIGASAGTAGAFAVGRPVLGPALGGWRPLFLYSGLVAVGYAVVWLVGVAACDVDGESSTDDASFTPSSLSGDLRTVLTHSELRLVVLLGVTYLLVMHGLQGWLPTILEARGLSPARAGQTTTLLVIANVGGILLVPWLADRFRVRRPAVIGCGLLAGGGVAGIVVGDVGLVVAGGIVAAGLGVGGLSPLVRAIPPELDGIGAELTGVAIGLVFAVGEIGGFLGPVLIGALFDISESYVPGLAVLAAGGLIASVAGRAMQANQ
jgi:cyanate permease